MCHCGAPPCKPFLGGNPVILVGDAAARVPPVPALVVRGRDVLASPTMRRIAALVLLVMSSCSSEPAPVPVGGGPAAASCGAVPCSPMPCAAANGSAAAVGGAGVPPAFVAGLATLRVGVYGSKLAAEVGKRKLGALVGGRGWRLQVWGTRSGRVASVRARLQVAGVDPAAASALCLWLAGKGWDSGALPCELRR